MKKVQVLCDEVNGVVVQVEGRSFPGLVLQGDQLFALASLAAKLGPEHRDLRNLLYQHYTWYMEHGGDPRQRKHLTSEDVINTIKDKFASTGNKAAIPLLRPTKSNSTFNAECRNDGIYVSNLGNQSFLPWSVFSETVQLIQKNNGHAAKGNATNHRLGSEGLPFDSIEGNVARKVYGKKIGDSVFRRIVPIACILVWAGICKSEPGELLLR